MSKWSQYKSSGTGSGGLFIRVESGAPGVEFLVPPGAIPHERYVSWVDGKPVEEDGPGEGVTCRILMQVVRPSGEPGILEMPPGTFSDLCAALDHPKVGGTDQIYEVSKTGSGMQTRWKVARLDRATPEQIARAGRVALPEIKNGRPMRASGESAATADIREPGDEDPDASVPF